jgi:PEP-CTERM motif
MTRIPAIIQSIMAAICVSSAQGQGVFQNLDFESAAISQNQGLGVVNTTDALPGWNVYFGPNGPQAQVDFEGLISSWVVLLGTNNIGDGSSIEGEFSIYLTGQQVAFPGEADSPAGSINQTGLVPANAESILFKAQPGTASFVVSLDGQNITLTDLATGPNYTLFGGDISAFAGQTSELAFTAGIFGTGWNLDSIEFSPEAVPEPSTWALLVAGSGLFFFRRQPR